MKSYYYNLEDAEFINSAGEKLSFCVPILSYQERAEWVIHLRDRENAVVDIGGVVAWSAAVDCDFRGGTPPMCRTLPSGISSDVAAGTVSVVIDAATEEFLAAVDGSRSRNAYFELCGVDAQGERVVYLLFPITARMTLDPDPTVSGNVPDNLATRSFVSALLTVSASDVISDVVSGALVSAFADVPTSSGAAVIASAAAVNVISAQREDGNIVGQEYIDGLEDRLAARITPIEETYVQKMVVTSSAETSAGLVLSGGTSYIFTEPLHSLTISGAEVLTSSDASVTASEAHLHFTLAPGGAVTVAPSLTTLNDPAFAGGAGYVVAVNELGLVAGEVTE